MAPHLHTVHQDALLDVGEGVDADTREEDRAMDRAAEMMQPCATIESVATPTRCDTASAKTNLRAGAAASGSSAATSRCRG